MDGLISSFLPMPLWVLFSFCVPSAVLRLGLTQEETTSEQTSAYFARQTQARLVVSDLGFTVKWKMPIVLGT